MLKNIVYEENKRIRFVGKSLFFWWQIWQPIRSQFSEVFANQTLYFLEINSFFLLVFRFYTTPLERCIWKNLHRGKSGPFIRQTKQRSFFRRETGNCIIFDTAIQYSLYSEELNICKTFFNLIGNSVSRNTLISICFALAKFEFGPRDVSFKTGTGILEGGTSRSTLGRVDFWTSF